MALEISGTGVYRGVHIGHAHGRIALWLTKDEAIALHNILGVDDLGAAELSEAIDVAYPPPEPDCEPRERRESSVRSVPSEEQP